MGRIPEAAALLEEAIQHGYRWAQPQFMAYLSEVRRREHRAADAAELAARACALALEYQQRGVEALSLRVLGEIAAHRDPPDSEEAESHYRQAMALGVELGMRPLVAHCHLGLGQLYRRTGKRQGAEEHLTSAATMYIAS